LFSYCEGVIDLDPEVSDRALDLGIPSKSWAGSPCIAACLRHPNERSQIGHVEPHRHPVVHPSGLPKAKLVSSALWRRRLLAIVTKG